MLRREALLGGHRSPVLSICSDSDFTVATGASDGCVRIFDLRQHVQGASAALRAARCCVAAVPSTAVNSSTEVAAVRFSPASSSDRLWCSVGRDIVCFDLRRNDQVLLREPLFAWRGVVADEINGIDVRSVSGRPASAELDNLDAGDSFVLAASDTGEVIVFDTRDATEGSANNSKIWKTLSGVHDNICSAVVLHPDPRRQWECFTSGLDTRVVRWRFDRAKTLATHLFGGPLETDAAAAGTASIPDQANARAQAGSRKDRRRKGAKSNGRNRSQAAAQATVHPPTSSTPQLNPPMCHALAIQASGELLAAGLQDGSVALFDISKPSMLSLVALDEFTHAGCITALTFGLQGLVSGSLDRSISVWAIAGNEKKATDKLRLRFTQDHGSKINCISSVRNGVGISVGDQTHNATVYHLQEG